MPLKTTCPLEFYWLVGDGYLPTNEGWILTLLRINSIYMLIWCHFNRSVIFIGVLRTSMRFHEASTRVRFSLCYVLILYMLIIWCHFYRSIEDYISIRHINKGSILTSLHINSIYVNLMSLKISLMHKIGYFSPSQPRFDSQPLWVALHLKK